MSAVWWTFGLDLDHLAAFGRRCREAGASSRFQAFVREWRSHGIAHLGGPVDFARAHRAAQGDRQVDGVLESMRAGVLPYVAEEGPAPLDFSSWEEAAGAVEPNAPVQREGAMEVARCLWTHGRAVELLVIDAYALTHDGRPGLKLLLDAARGVHAVTLWTAWGDAESRLPAKDELWPAAAQVWPAGGHQRLSILGMPINDARSLFHERILAARPLVGNVESYRALWVGKGMATFKAGHQVLVGRLASRFVHHLKACLGGHLVEVHNPAQSTRGDAPAPSHVPTASLPPPAP